MTTPKQRTELGVQPAEWILDETSTGVDTLPYPPRLIVDNGPSWTSLRASHDPVASTRGDSDLARTSRPVLVLHAVMDVASGSVIRSWIDVSSEPDPTPGQTEA